MVPFNTRLKSLKNFHPQPIIEILDEKNDTEYIIIFVPLLNVMVIERANFCDETPIVVSYGDFTKSCENFDLNNRNCLDAVLSFVIKAWKQTESGLRMAFFDSIPLNSLYIGGNYI